MNFPFKLMRSAVSIYSSIAAVLLLGGSLQTSDAAAVADGMPNSKPKQWPANPAKHVVKIVREAADDQQKSLIPKAEAALPSLEALKKAAGETGIPKGENVWWYKESLGIRIPFAVIGDAVTYYSDLVTAYGKQAFNRYAEPSSSLSYQAGVKFHKEFKLGEKSFSGVNVVTLKLTFSQNFSATQTEGMQIQKERVVVLDASGKVLQISGDGETEVPIMAI